MKDWLLEHAPALILLGLLLIPISYLTSNFKPCDGTLKKVIKVGGCDRVGYCGVIFENGESGRARYPVEGAYTKEVLCQ